jgi:hypothetical protein
VEDIVSGKWFYFQIEQEKILLIIRTLERIFYYYLNLNISLMT